MTIERPHRRALPVLAVLLALGPAVPPAAGASSAREPAATLTLTEAMSRARASAREVAAAEARRLASDARLDQAKSHRLPQIRLSEIWMRTDSPAEVFALQLNQERFSFPDFVSSDPNDPDPLSNATTRLELGVPVYTGGELAARIRQAELASQAAGEQSLRTADESAFAAAEAFVRLAQAREQVALLERALETVDAHVALARAYVDQGMLVASELLRAEVEASRIADLLARARGQAKVAEAALSFRLAADLASTWELAPLGAPGDLEAGIDSWLAGAEQRADLSAAAKMARIAELEIDAAAAARRPRIGVMARYDLSDEQLFGDSGDNAALMAVAGIDLFSGGRHRAAKAAAEAEARAATADVHRFGEGVRLEIRQAYEDAVSARDRYATATAAVVSAAETERIMEQRFRQGVVKTLDLLDAATARREAETRELVARSDAHLAALRLALAAGRTPESALASLTGATTP